MRGESEQNRVDRAIGGISSSESIGFTIQRAYLERMTIQRIGVVQWNTHAGITMALVPFRAVAYPTSRVDFVQRM